MFSLRTFFTILTGFSSAVNSDYLEATNYDTEFEGKDHPCYRECGGATMICEYNLTIRSATSMNVMDCGDCPFVIEDCSKKGCITAGGILRSVIAANQKIPGPSILVCEYDRIIVNVKNELRTETLTIHWHGIHQTGTLFMDGVPYVTQYPVQPLGTFKYDFIAEPHGTQMWHGHSGFQESDGLFGILTVRRKEPEIIQNLYDFDLPEHTMIIWHWYDKPTGDVLQSVLHQNGKIYGYGFLVNGKGGLKHFKREDGREIYTPREIFYVQKGKRYRFRLIYNSAIYCPLQVSIDDHKINVFASDTSSFEPVEVDSFMVSAGERYDFVLTANQSENCYWLRLRALGDCGEKKNKVHGAALVCYENVTAFDDSVKLLYEDGKKTGVLLNPSELLTQDYSKNRLIRLTDLNSTENEVDIYNQQPNITFYIEINSRPIEQLRYPGPWHQFNYISFLFPDPSFLKNEMLADGGNFCDDDDENQYEKCKTIFCSCTYVKNIPKGSLVEMIIFDSSQNRDQDHPVHMHGYKFYVVSEGVIGENITLEDMKFKNENGIIPKKLKNAPSKDTITVPNNGYIILRFNASNIGIWMLHCHVTNHMELGMALMFQVGTREEILNMCLQNDKCNIWKKSGADKHRNYLLLFVVLFNVLYFYS